MNESIKYYHFEGMDLAGKTTATKNFIKSTGEEWQVRRNSLIDDNPIYNLADSLRLKGQYDSEILGNLYVAALKADINGFQTPKMNTLQDSTILLRSLSYYIVSGIPRLEELFREMIPAHPQFDASFILTADIETRRQRLAKRQNENPSEVAADDLMVIKNPERFMAMESCLINLTSNIFNSVIIDTSALTSEMVVEKINQNLSK